jgi:hypothetical protein
MIQATGKKVWAGSFSSHALVEMAEGNIPTSCGDHMPALSHMREKPEQEPGDKVVLAFDGDGTRESPLYRNGPATRVAA